ncbi:MAG: hypothetical protein JST87_05265 [Bacteroidetes bacterium]|nr:hypothetical protein [Bacteroidota bacterium]
MKKFFCLIALVSAFCFQSHAQFATATTFPLIAGDTLTNTDTVTKVIKATAGYEASSIQVNLNKISGTIGGKVYLFQSDDGVNFIVTDSANYTTLSTTTPSIQTPSATASAIFLKNPIHSVYYLVAATSTGTVSAQVRVLYTLRKWQLSTSSF